MTVFRGSAYLLISLALTAHLTEAMVCQMGQEPDLNARRYRWVIPVEDPCKCTEIRPGGINNRTPGRHFKVIYFDTFLISNSPKEIRKWLNCSDASQNNKEPTELIGRTPASQPAVITTHATSNAPATSDIPATSNAPVTSDIPATRDKLVFTGFSCEGRVDNGHYTDPNDCTMFYHCDNGRAHHKSCPADLHFIEARQRCDWPYNDNCQQSMPALP